MTAFEWFVAWRYLFSRERKALVSMITIISMAGVMVGVAALIVVIGVMDGADELLFGKIADLYPHISIADTSGRPLDPVLLKALRENPNVTLAEPIIKQQAFMQAGAGIEARKQGIQLIGADELGPDSPFAIAQDESQRVQLRDKQILLGYPLAASLNAFPESRVLVFATNPIATAVGPMLKQTQLEVMNRYYNSQFYDFDANTAFVNTKEIRKLFRIPEGVYDYIHVKLQNPFASEKIKNQLLETIPALREGDFRITTWADENAAFFGALKLEKLGLFIILMLIILVAAFNIIGTLILMVIEKTREVGILRAVGASERTISRIFLLDGVMVGLVGTIAGVVIGVGICTLIPVIKIEMPPAVYNFNYLPVKVNLLTVAIIVTSAMSVCTLAALFPARQAAKLNPVEALRYD